MIEKLFHHYWAQGENNFPDRERKERAECAKLHPEFRFKLWDQYTGRELVDKHLYKCWDLAVNYSEQSDLVRWCALYEHGGVWADTDFIWNRSILNTISQLTGFMGLMQMNEQNAVAYMCSVVGFFKGHQFTQAVIDALPERMTHSEMDSGAKLGSLAQIILIDKYRGDDVVSLLPPWMFYPKNNLQYHKDFGHEAELRNNPCIAFHTYSGSWLDPSCNVTP